MNILLTNKQVGILKESIEAQNISKEDFIKEVKSFLYSILSNEQTKPQSNFWKLNGLTNSEVMSKLIRSGIVEKQSIMSEDEDIPKNKIVVPKKNFERKVDRLYYDMFPEHEIVTEDGEGGGANTCSSVGGSYEAPFMSPISRKIGGF